MISRRGASAAPCRSLRRQSTERVIWNLLTLFLSCRTFCRQSEISRNGDSRSLEKVEQARLRANEKRDGFNEQFEQFGRIMI